MDELRFVIPGECRTKKNHMMIAGAGARCPVCKKPQKQWIRQGTAHDTYAKKAVLLLRPRPKKPIDYPINVKCLFYMATRRKVDALNLQATIDDLLIEAGIIEDDNSTIIVAHDGSRVRYDKEHPRTEIYITEMEDDGE